MTTNELLWVTSRATGVVSLVLLTAVLALGVALSGSRSGSPSTRATVTAVHRWLGLGIGTFVVAHVVTAIVETWVDIGWLSLVLPFTSGYERLWVGLGTLALDVLVAVVVTSALRHRLPEHAWRLVHLTGYALWPVAVVHGIALGTSTTPLLRWASIGCALVGGAAIAWRLLVPHNDARQRATAAAGVWS